MVIKNKMESINVINKLGLNKFPEQLFKKNEKDKIKEFTKEYPAKYYAIRDREKPGGTFKLKVEKDNIFDEIKNYNLFSIKKLNNIKHYEEIYSYIIKNELKDIIVEFALFDINVGINKENIIIYELRTNY